MYNVSHFRYWLNNRQISFFDVNVANLINLVYCLIQNSPAEEASKSGPACNYLLRACLSLLPGCWPPGRSLDRAEVECSQKSVCRILYKWESGVRLQKYTCLQWIDHLILLPHCAFLDGVQVDICILSHVFNIFCEFPTVVSIKCHCV